ncbi:MAG: transcriptional regulator, Fis family [Planctomycetaceae bacterium]|nr:transcriptional regulator, Fis family [Planctomycetaceae bacterium]
MLDSSRGQVGKHGVASAASEVSDKRLSAADYLPAELTLESLRTAASKCEGCDLYVRATQTVFGSGPAPAALMFIGEAPGEKEDDAGQPFVGPAGKLLDDAFTAAGINRNEVYLTNTVKHFKWEPVGKRRLHAKPNSREISACQPWLLAEIQTVAPKLIVCLGATAAQSLLGHKFRITRQRGQLLALPNGQQVLSTWHPSSILRTPDADARQRMQEELFLDLRAAATFARE